MIALDGTDVGWLQAIRQDDELFVVQMFVDGPFQRRGIGTEVMNRLIGEANEFNRAVRLMLSESIPLGGFTSDSASESHMKRIASSIRSAIPISLDSDMLHGLSVSCSFQTRI
jgi:GNAT superfamily N-acetyltransferase